MNSESFNSSLIQCDPKRAISLQLVSVHVVKAAIKINDVEAPYRPLVR